MILMAASCTYGLRRLLQAFMSSLPISHVSYLPSRCNCPIDLWSRAKLRIPHPSSHHQLRTGGTTLHYYHHHLRSLASDMTWVFRSAQACLMPPSSTINALSSSYLPELAVPRPLHLSSTAPSCRRRSRRRTCRNNRVQAGCLRGTTTASHCAVALTLLQGLLSRRSPSSCATAPLLPPPSPALPPRAQVCCNMLAAQNCGEKWPSPPRSDAPRLETYCLPLRTRGACSRDTVRLYTQRSCASTVLYMYPANATYSSARHSCSKSLRCALRWTLPA
ncbi:hypothetical protein C8F04DRAFT_340029 [Mycena alexandri]|uniref:Uncharacterized protein n=1 Tax=Mycena alexandri TaxID=1745969 RepID=A0AAD6TGE0_9AGAR|nr:hypothetical protein C8F04DRAFT_340029 [Mycena alexandri]